MDKSAPVDEAEIALVAVVLNTSMPGVRQPINSNSDMLGRVGGQPTPQGSPIGLTPNHMMAYNAHLQQHYTPRLGLLPPAQLSSAPCPNYHPMAHQEQGYGNGMPGHDMYAFQPQSGGQLSPQSSNGSYAPAQNAHQQAARVSNGFNAPTASSMQVQQHLQQQIPGGQQRMTPLPAAAAPSRTTPSISSTTSSPSPVPQSISTWKKVYFCGVCPDSDSPYHYDETDDEQPPSLTVCRSEHLMDSAVCKANFLKLFGSDWKKASGSECLEREVIEEAVWCVLCQVMIRGKDKWRRLHLMSAEHQNKLASNAPPILAQQLHLNDLQQQHQQQNLAMLQQQQRMVFQQQPAQHYQMAQHLQQPQEVFQQTLQSSYQAPNMIHISPPPAYPIGNGMAGQMATSRSTHCRSNRSSTKASPATNDQKNREQRILTLLGQHAGRALQKQGGQEEGMLPLGGAFHESVEARPSAASSVSVGSTPRGCVSFDDISPHNSPTAQPSLPPPVTITPQSTTPAVASMDNRPRYQSPMDMAAEVMNDPGSFPDGLDLPSASSQGSLSSEPIHILSPTVNVPAKADPVATAATPVSPTVEVAPSAAPVVIPAAAQTS
ncbi:hypothetical protein RvY_09778-2 [Ramazzottius varieornatus]|nr:hypothetical protein RvY_09778-2 [Ramazzottius varieornatus]